MLLVSKSKKIKEASIFWNREKLGNSDTFASLSHWQNSRNWDENRFKAWGELNLQRYKQLITYMQSEKDSVKRVIEWGPGGGSNAVAFLSKLNCHYTAVDISIENLQETQRQCRNFEKNLNTIHIDITNIEHVLRVLSISSFDLFLITSVIPHLPTREHFERIMKIAYKLLKPNGFFIGSVIIGSKTRATKKSYFHSPNSSLIYTFQDFNFLMRKSGFEITYLTLDNFTSKKTTYCFYFCRKIE